MTSQVFAINDYYHKDSIKSNAVVAPESTTFDVGISLNYYFYGITPLEIYAYDVNSASSTTDKFTHLNYIPGIVLRLAGEIPVGFEFCRNTIRTDASYSTLDGAGNVIPMTEKLKLSNSIFKFLYFYSQPSNPFYFGTSIDIGLFKTMRKYVAEGYDDKWQPFYSHTGLIKSISPSSLTAGVSLYVGLKIDRFKLQLSRQFLIMDAELNGYTGTDVLFNTQHYQMSLTYGF